MRVLVFLAATVLTILIASSLLNHLIAPFGCDTLLCIPMCTTTDDHVCPK